MEPENMKLTVDGREVPKENYVHCHRCGRLTGIKVKSTTQPKMEQIWFTVGKTEYPSIDIDNVGSSEIRCQFCGVVLEKKGEK